MTYHTSMHDNDLVPSRPIADEPHYTCGYDHDPTEDLAKAKASYTHAKNRLIATQEFYREDPQGRSAGGIIAEDTIRFRRAKAYYETVLAYHTRYTDMISAGIDPVKFNLLINDLKRACTNYQLCLMDQATYRQSTDNSHDLDFLNNQVVKARLTYTILKSRLDGYVKLLLPPQEES